MPDFGLTPWHIWNQLADSTWDGAADENRFNNCGPESVAMCLWHLTGVALPADTIKDAIGGEAFAGYTSFQQLAGFLEQYCSTPTRTYTGDASTRLQPVVEAALKAHHPIIVLTFFDLVNLKGGHFTPIVSCTDTSVTRANPWGGVYDTWSWPEFERYQQDGGALELLRVRVVANSTPEAPPVIPPVAATTPPVAWVVTMEQDLRAAPALDAPHGVRVTTGERLPVAHTSTWSTHWAYVQPPAPAASGWLLKSNGVPVYK